MMRFIHIPKNAGTTVGKMLGRNGIPFVVGMPDQQHTRHWFGRDFQDLLPRFAIVRNPLTRMVSWYEWIRRLPNYSSMSFDQFVIGRVERGRARMAWTLQTEWTHCEQRQQRVVETILRYEHLERDLRLLFPSMGPKFLHLNSGSIVDYSAYYTPTTRKIVREAFYEDFMNFGYDDK